jgi:hypothetical protein
LAHAATPSVTSSIAGVLPDDGGQTAAVLGATAGRGGREHREIPLVGHGCERMSSNVQDGTDMDLEGGLE